VNATSTALTRCPSCQRARGSIWNTSVSAIHSHFCERRLEIIADRIHGHADVGELEEQLFFYVARGDLFGRCR
jgi:hypothetical protein